MGRALRRRWNVDRVVSSPRRRALQTVAEAGLEAVSTTTDDRWQEIDFGSYDDQPMSEVLAELESAWAADVDFTPPGGESLADLHRRVGEALADLTGPARTTDIVVVSHATPIKSAMAWLLGGDARMIMRARVRLASITAFDASSKGLVLTELNWTGSPEPPETERHRLAPKAMEPSMDSRGELR